MTATLTAPGVTSTFVAIHLALPGDTGPDFTDFETHSTRGAADEAFDRMLALFPGHFVAVTEMEWSAPIDGAWQVHLHVDSELTDGLKGDILREHSPESFLRYEIAGPNITGFDDQYLVYDVIRAHSFGHSSDDAVPTGSYHDLPEGFEDSQP